MLVSDFMVNKKNSQLKMPVEVRSRSLKILQWSFLCLNVLILLIGVTLMSLSVSKIVQRQEFVKESERNKVLVDNDVNMTITIIATAIAISVLIIFLSLFGLCGAFSGKKCLLSYYLVFVLLNLALVIVGGMMVLRFSQKPGYFLNEHMSNYHRNKTSKDRVDRIRSKLNCCGSEDFPHTDNLTAELKKIVSTSCCKPQHKKACRDLLEGHTTEMGKWEGIRKLIYTEGCLLKITEMSGRISQLISSFFIVIGVINLAGSLLSTALCCSV